MALSVVTWLLMAKPRVPSISFLYLVNVAKAINLAGATGDITSGVAKADIMLD